MTAYDALRTTGTSADVVRSIFDMHFPAAESVLDLTFGRGTFWRWPWQGKFTLHANDAHADLPTIGADLVAVSSWDFTDCPPCAEWQRYDVVVFDPPFTANGPQKGKDRHQDRYGSTRDQNGAPQNIHDVHRLLCEGIRNACRLARLGVIVKTQSVIESGRYWDSEAIAYTALANARYRVADKVWLLTARRTQPDAARASQIQHFRNRPSVFVVATPGAVTLPMAGVAG